MKSNKQSSENPLVLVAVSDGSEDIETVSIIDTLRRAECEVVIGKVPPHTTKHGGKDHPLQVTLMKGIKIVSIFKSFNWGLVS